MRYCKNKDIDREIRILIKKGWIYQRRRKHGMIIAPTVDRITISMTPSCHRTKQNFCALIRSAEEL